MLQRATTLSDKSRQLTPVVRSVALFPLWFLGIASVANGLLHPLLALNAGGYFPGLATSPLVAAVGALLLARLSRVTA